MYQRLKKKDIIADFIGIKKQIDLGKECHFLNSYIYFLIGADDLFGLFLKYTMNFF